MIDINTLKEADVGLWVRYTAPHGSQEKGRIKSWNDKWVFVVYKCAGEWERFQDYTGCSTDPRDLTILKKKMYYYLHSNGEIIKKPAMVVELGTTPAEYFDSDFVKKYWVEYD